MALSNIFNEPRREIVETLVGLVVFAVVAFLIYYPAPWIQAYFGHGMPLVIAMLFEVLGLMVGIVLLVMLHAAGDEICNWLQDRGIHLRPRQRYNRR